MTVLQGEGVSRGVASGKLRFLRRDARAQPRRQVADAEAEVARFDKARGEAVVQLAKLYVETKAKLGEEKSLLFQIHQMMLEDLDYRDTVTSIIRNQHVNAEYAVDQTAAQFSEMFTQMDDDYMKERAADVLDVSRRVIRLLTGQEDEELGGGEPCIIAADDLAPSETARLDQSKVLCFITARGSSNSHAAIFARTMGIPAVVGLGDSLLEEFLRHLAMTSFSVVLALIIAVPLGIFITRNKAVSNVVIGIANVMQSIPCMALLAMGIPFLGVGETLAIFMVFVYAFLPILKNTYTGISGISPVSMEVARGIGLTRMQQLRRVELPMAMPYIMSGIRIAAVSSVGTMTIAAFAGANGLGSFIQLGMNSLNYPMTIMGAVAAALMALTLDFLLGRVERAFTSEGLLPQDQIKNLSLSVRSRRKAMAAALCGALLVVSVASYASIIA